MGGFVVCVARIALTSLQPFPIMRAVSVSKYGSLAQLVEQWTLNPLVESSNLSRPTIKSRLAVNGDLNPRKTGGEADF